MFEYTDLFVALHKSEEIESFILSHKKPWEKYSVEVMIGEFKNLIFVEAKIWESPKAI